MPKYIIDVDMDEFDMKSLIEENIGRYLNEPKWSITVAPKDMPPKDMSIEEKLKALPPTECKMVFAISKQDDYGHPGQEYLFIGSEKDWDIATSTGYLSDGYSYDEGDLVADTIHALDIKAFESMESTYEMMEPADWPGKDDPDNPVNNYSDYVRHILGQAPGFTYDPKFEKWLDSQS